jgi:hypothetical protein
MKQDLAKEVRKLLNLNENPIVNKKLPLDKQKELKPASFEWAEKETDDAFDELLEWQRKAGIK